MNSSRTLEGIEVEMSSGNVFADLGLPDADTLKIKSGLAIEIAKAINTLDLSQEEAGRRMNVPKSKVSRLISRDFSKLSEQELMKCLNRLGYNIEITLRPTPEPIGHLMLSVA